ncbi:S8 family serine peptidase [Dyadobacter sp. 676]|uniref:S8 family serine peptidase n=1 Tax=Dyadobacter sp. 676 TaxID=3088362 RepID=A0AAU8FEK1_9BACT
MTYLISSLADTDRIFELTEKLYQSQIFEYVEPKFWLFVETASDHKKRPLVICTNDQYYPQQWLLNNTGQSGGIVDADIDAPEAWAITSGSPSVRIAILDNGTERNHPDLTANITGGSDATGGSGGCAYPATNGNPNWCAGDAHGTWVAGVAAAVGCTGVGVTGVAYGSKIVPVRVFQGTTLTNADWVASGINYARNNAEIINMSFTLAAPSSTVDTQISQAVTTGRGGKGVILVAASGNNAGSTPGYPSINQNVVSVGRTTNQDLRFMDSQYGPGLDLVAPGVDIWTTDLTGATGANTGDYAAVGGTSFASAAVSGAFALLLSVNPNLTISQARMLLESTTDKISLGTYSYASTPNQNNGAWNNEVGYGRVNVNNTLIAMRNSNITGPSIICTSGTFNLTFKPNVPKTWYSSNTSILTINSVTGVATRVGSGSGPVTITMRYSVLSTTYDITKEIWVGTPDVSTIKYDNGISAGGAIMFHPIPTIQYIWINRTS